MSVPENGYDQMGKCFPIFDLDSPEAVVSFDKVGVNLNGLLSVDNSLIMFAFTRVRRSPV